MFGKKNKNTYDSTSVLNEGGQQYGSDIHGISLNVNQTVWNMLNVLKEKKLFGFHLSPRLGVKKTIIVIIHEDVEMLKKAKRILRPLCEGNIRIVTKVASDDKNKKITKYLLTTFATLLLLLGGGIYYLFSKNQENERELQQIASFSSSDGLNGKLDKGKIEKNIKINVDMMSELNEKFNDKNTERLKQVFGEVLDKAISMDVFGKEELDNDKILSAYEDPNAKYEIQWTGKSRIEDKDVLKDIMKISKAHTSAQLYSKKGKNREAEKSFNEALKISKKLSDKNITQYGDIFANNFKDMGDFYKDTNRPKKAEKAYLNAMDVYKKLANKSDTNPYNIMLANGFVKLGNINLSMDKKTLAENYFKEAEKRYKRIIELYRKIIKKEPNRYEGHLAHSLNGFSNLYIEYKRNYIKATELAEEALKIYKSNPKRYKRLTAFTLYKTAYLYGLQKRFDMAEKRYNEIKNIKNGNNDKNYNLYIAQSLNALAWIHTREEKFRDLEKAKSEANSALKIYLELIKKNPKIASLVSFSYFNLGFIAMIEEKQNEAIEAYKKGLEIDKNLENTILYAEILAKYKKYREANGIFQNALKEYQKKEEQAKILMSYGEFYMNIDKKEGRNKIKKATLLYKEISLKD